MSKINQSSVKKILAQKLSLVKPEFYLQKEGSRISGSIVSATFLGKKDNQRQEMIWNAIESEFGPEATETIGMLLAFTPAEWNIEPIIKTKPRSKAS